MTPPDSRFPSASDYTNEPVQHSPLVVVDVAAEQRQVAEPYRNTVLSRINTHCMRLAVFEGGRVPLASPSAFRRDVSGCRGAFGDRPCGRPDARPRTLASGRHSSRDSASRTRAIGRTVNLTFEALGADTVFVD